VGSSICNALERKLAASLVRPTPRRVSAPNPVLARSGAVYASVTLASVPSPRPSPTITTTCRTARQYTCAGRMSAHRSALSTTRSGTACMTPRATARRRVASWGSWLVHAGENTASAGRSESCGDREAGPGRRQPMLKNPPWRRSGSPGFFGDFRRKRVPAIRPKSADKLRSPTRAQ
jgi:hypothetical protein